MVGTSAASASQKLLPSPFGRGAGGEGRSEIGASQIIPLVIGDPERTVEMSAELRDRGLFVPAVRPPTVPEGEACLRISLTAGHTGEMIVALLTALGSSR